MFKDMLMKRTFAVLKATFLQSGKMLTDHAGKRYDLPLKVTVASDCVPMFARKAAHDPDEVLYTAACEVTNHICKMIKNQSMLHARSGVTLKFYCYYLQI